jgi:hypothetical protein
MFIQMWSSTAGAVETVEKPRLSGFSKQAVEIIKQKSRRRHPY